MKTKELAIIWSLTFLGHLPGIIINGFTEARQVLLGTDLIHCLTWWMIYWLWFWLKTKLASHN